MTSRPYGRSISPRRLLVNYAGENLQLSASWSMQMKNTEIKTFTWCACGSPSERTRPWNFYLPWREQLSFLSNPSERFGCNAQEKNTDLKQFD